MCVPASGSLFEAIDGSLETIDLRLILVDILGDDIFLNKTVEKCRFQVHLSYFIVIPYCYSKQDPNRLGHSYERIGFLKIDPRSLSISLCHELSLESSNLPVSS
ncbi:UNVERIFIED_CONTAM: hypothetical protein Sradi_5096300 [Sesamum radiatum]|uniref:Uncharacterized protein n=1 Tax=Sesamum radiatum TaxID=300843 RepID=A0AAW2M416_SESRA